MSNRPINQHYVWQNYLQEWTDNRKIWCKRLGQVKPFTTSPRNIASKRFFYEFFELTNDDAAYLEHIISKSSDKSLQEINRNWVAYFQATFFIRRQLKSQNVSPENQNRLEVELTTLEKTLGELYHGAAENLAVPVLNALRRKRSSLF